MRRVGTWLVVVALGGLALAAMLDALVGEPDAPRVAVARTGTVPLLARQPQLAVAQLREAGVTGVLTFSDADCRLHALSLPELKPRPAPSVQICEPLTRSNGLGVVDGDVVWAGLGLGVVQEVLPRSRLSREVRIALGIPPDAREAAFRARQAVSLDDETYVVLADSTYEPRVRVVAVFAGSAATFVHQRSLVGGVRSVRPSPEGSYYALLGPGVVQGLGTPIFARDGRLLARPDGIPSPHAVAWSPDERWTALATADSVFVYPTDRVDLVVRIPLAVRDLDWNE